MANNTIVISVDVGEIRVASLEDGILAELYVEREAERSPVGNIYLGKVTRVLPGMQAAFVDIGLDRAAFLHVEDVLPTKDLDKLAEKDDGAEAENDENGGTKRGRVTRKTPIREVLKEGQHIVVQVSKGPISTKGARVTSHVSLPGRYAVYMPTIDHVGDRDFYCFEAEDNWSAPGFGEHIRVMLEDIPNGADFDLFLYRSVADCNAGTDAVLQRNVCCRGNGVAALRERPRRAPGPPPW